MKKKPDNRETILNLLSERFDHSGSNPQTKLIIAANARTGSYLLTRGLTAAGIGVPLDYFFPPVIEALSDRWGIERNEEGSIPLASYTQTLVQKRTANGVLSSKFRYTDFHRIWKLGAAKQIVDGAKFVFLFRRDVLSQAASLAASMRTGKWDFSDDKLTPIYDDKEQDADSMAEALQAVMMHHAGWELFFLACGVRPLRISYEDLLKDPEAQVEAVASHVGVEPDKAAMKAALKKEKDAAYKTNQTLKNRFLNLQRSDLRAAYFRLPLQISDDLS